MPPTLAHPPAAPRHIPGCGTAAGPRAAWSGGRGPRQTIMSYVFQPPPILLRPVKGAEALPVPR